MSEDYLSKLETSGAPKLYEDEHMLAYLSPEPACMGHIVLVPKEKHVIIEQVPDPVIAKIFAVANKLSIAAFDALGVLGTNILIQNGTAAGQKEPHLVINILPRTDEDGLSFAWKSKQVGEEEMSTIELQLKELSAKIGTLEPENRGPEKKHDEPVEVDSLPDDLREKMLSRIG